MHRSLPLLAALALAACATTVPGPPLPPPPAAAMDFAAPPAEVLVRIVDVGGGLCTVTRAPGPHFMLYDAGSAGAANRYLAAGVPVANIYRTDRGDHEPGEYEWTHGRINDCKDPRGADDVEIHLRGGQPPSVRYFRASNGC